MKATFSFRPHERLKKRSQFQKVYKKGRPVKGKNFTLIYLASQLRYNRIGLSVVAKKTPRASRRVRIKRFLREAYRLNKPLLKRGFDIVIIANAGAKNQGFESVEKEVKSLLSKISSKGVE